jgi:hypothetical protein
VNGGIGGAMLGKKIESLKDKTYRQVAKMRSVL